MIHKAVRPGDTGSPIGIPGFRIIFLRLNFPKHGGLQKST